MSSRVFIMAALFALWTGWHLYGLQKLRAQRQRGEDFVVDGLVTRSSEGADYDAAAREKRKRLINAILIPPAIIVVNYLLQMIP